MSGKIKKRWIAKSAIPIDSIAWAQAASFVIFSLVVCSSSAWHNGEPTVHITSAQFQNPVAGFSHSSSGNYPAISWATRAKQFVQDYVRISAPHQPSNHKQTSNVPIDQADFSRELANSSQQYISWFFDQQILIGTMTQDQVLRLYKLYSNPGFLAYIKRFPGYGDHVLSVHARLIDPAHNRKKVFQEMGLKESVSMFNLFARCAQEVKDRRAAQEQERALREQAARLQQEELLHNSRKVEGEYQQCVTSFFPVRPECFAKQNVSREASLSKGKGKRRSKAADLAHCVVGWHTKQYGANSARYQKRLAAVQKLAQNLDQNKQKIKRVYTITDRDHELIKELNLRKSDFVVLQGHELQHVLHREFIGILRNISDFCRVTVGSITGQYWTELFGTYVNTGMQANKMGDCAQASKIADFCWAVTAGLGEILLGVGEGIWQGGKNVAHMVLHPLDTGYGAGCALGVMLIGCGDIIMSTGDPELPIDHGYSTFQRARDPAQAEYLLHIYNSLMVQASQATPRDIARGVSTMVTEAILTAKLSSAAVKCITSINSRAPGALHCALSCAPETAESFALADGGHMRISKNALQALAESEAAEARAATLLRDGSVQSGKILPPVLNSKELAEETAKRAAEILSCMNPHLDDLAKNGNKIKKIGDKVFKVSHTFSSDHIRDNILNVSKTAEATAVECINIIRKVDGANLLVEGINNLHAFVNHVPLEIRLFIKDGTLMYFNGFVGHSNRNVKHLVKIEKGAIWKVI